MIGSLYLKKAFSSVDEFSAWWYKHLIIYLHLALPVNICFFQAILVLLLEFNKCVLYM